MNILRKRSVGGLNKKTLKDDFSTALASAILKNPTKSIRKQENKLKILERTVRTPIKIDLSLHFNSLYKSRFTIQNKCNSQFKYLFCLGLLFTRNGIKYLNIFFKKHANNFEEVFIQ